MATDRHFVRQTEVGLVYDAVRLFAKALHDLDQTQAINVRAVSCETEEPWQYGNAVTNYMRMVCHPVRCVRARAQPMSC